MAIVRTKRKAITHDSPTADEVVLSDGSTSEADEAFANSYLSDSSPDFDQLDNVERDQSGSGSEHNELEDLDETIDSDEIPSEEETELLDGKDQADVGSKDEIERGLSGNSRVVEDANGNPKFIFDEIDPVYDSDDSEAPPITNTIGNIPLSFYDSYPHIGYNIDGKKVARPAQGEALDALLDSIEVPEGWTGLTDPATGKPLELKPDELDVLKKIQMNQIPDENFDPYPATIEYFTSKTEQMPLSAAPEPKRRFVPSKHEAKRVMKIVRAIREGRILPYKPPAEGDQGDTTVKKYDIWANETPRPEHTMHIPAPKLPPPGYEESYHPPPEYLPEKKEQQEWEDADEEDREKDFLPSDHDALRKVPGYDRFIKEKFERCLDLYLAPRIRRNKLNIDPESLLPKLPNPDELRPFPTACSVIFHGHEGRVRSLAIDPSGVLLASGGDDGTVRIWELSRGRQIQSIKLSKDEAVDVVRWRPGTDTLILSAAAGENIHLIIPPQADPEVDARSREIIDAGWGYAANNASKPSKDASITWAKAGSRLEESGVLVKITLRKAVKVISWHRRGDYFATVSPQGSSSAVAIHTLSKHLTQFPFRKLRGLTQSAQFHPLKPIFFVATKEAIRSYDLSKQELLKIIQPGAKWISSFDIHRGGDNLIVGSYDKRLLWHDLDLSVRPYKTLRYHQKAIRAVRFHQGGLPLFADASDDGSLQVFHGKVVDDAMENATIVPLKVLKGHTVKRELGVLDLDWHPREAKCVSAGADGTCRFWV